MDYGLITIGAGSAGFYISIAINQLGFKVLLINREEIRFGGDCLNDGCVPSKSLIHLSRMMHQARKSRKFGLEVSGMVQELILANSSGVGSSKIFDEIYPYQLASRVNQGIFLEITLNHIGPVVENISQAVYCTDFAVTVKKEAAAFIIRQVTDVAVNFAIIHHICQMAIFFYIKIIPPGIHFCCFGIGSFHYLYQGAILQDISAKVAKLYSLIQKLEE